MKFRKKCMNGVQWSKNLKKIWYMSRKSEMRIVLLYRSNNAEQFEPLKSLLILPRAGL